MCDESLKAETPEMGCTVAVRAQQNLRRARTELGGEVVGTAREEDDEARADRHRGSDQPATAKRPPGEGARPENGLSAPVSLGGRVLPCTELLHPWKFAELVYALFVACTSIVLYVKCAHPVATRLVQ